MSRRVSKHRLLEPQSYAEWKRFHSPLIKNNSLEHRHCYRCISCSYFIGLQISDHVSHNVKMDSEIVAIMLAVGFSTTQNVT